MNLGFCFFLHILIQVPNLTVHYTSFNERNNRTLVSNSLHPCMCAPGGLERRPKQQGAAET